MIGIYCITNTTNNKVYIGQSIDIERRWQQERYGKCNRHLKHAFDRYGLQNFTFDILIELHGSEYLNDYESLCISLYESNNPAKGYNLTEGGSGPNGYKHTPDAISKLRGRVHSLETRTRISEAKKNISQETRRRMRDSHLGKKQSEATRELRATTARTLKQVRCVETGEIYLSATKASKSLGKSNEAVSHSIRYGTLCGGYHWEYVK